MAGAENPFNQIGGIDTVSSVIKADFVSWAKIRVPQVMASAAELRTFDLTGQNMVYVKSTQFAYASDTSDTTTADDGVSCIHDANGLRFKRIPVVGDVLKANNLSDLANKQTAYDNLSIHGSDVASASTLNLDTATGSVVDVTGTTTINAVTLSNGRRRLVRFTGALQITNGASLILPYGANVKTQAGDYALFVGYSGGVVRMAFFKPLNRPMFRVSKSASQNINDETFTTMTWDTETTDIGGYFASNAWVPPAGPVAINAFMLVGGTFTAGATVAIQIQKNGATVSQWATGASTASAFVGISIYEIANGTDSFTAVAYADTTGGQAVINSGGNSGFSGVWLG